MLRVLLILQGEKEQREEEERERELARKKMGGCVLTEGGRRPRDVDFTSYG